MYPVHRIQTLVDGGVYVARPTESCALMRSLVNHEANEEFPGHPWIDVGRQAKVDLHKKIEVR